MHRKKNNDKKIMTKKRNIQRHTERQKENQTIKLKNILSEKKKEIKIERLWYIGTDREIEL